MSGCAPVRERGLDERSVQHRQGTLTAQLRDELPVLDEEVVHGDVAVSQRLDGLSHRVELRPVDTVARSHHVLDVGAAAAGEVLRRQAQLKVRADRLQMTLRVSLHARHNNKIIIIIIIINRAESH